MVVAEISNSTTKQNKTVYIFLDILSIQNSTPPDQVDQVMCLFYTRGRFHHWFFAQNSNIITNLHCCNSIIDCQITTNFCTCHDSTAVVACAKFCSDIFPSIKMTAKWNLDGIWILVEKSLVQQSPEVMVCVPVAAYCQWRDPTDMVAPTRHPLNGHQGRFYCEVSLHIYRYSHCKDKMVLSL